MFWLWGAAGAFVFAINALIFELWNSGNTAGRRVQASAEFIAALLTGAIFAEGFTATVQPYVSHWVRVDSVALALTIGWSSNYLWPKLLRKLGERVGLMDL